MNILSVKNRSQAIVVVVGLLALASAIIMRLAMFNYQSGDYVVFWEVWLTRLREGGFRALGDGTWYDYNPPYMYILWLISLMPKTLEIRLFGYTSSFLLELYLIKFVSIIFDILLAWIVYKFARLFSIGQLPSFLISAGLLMLPTVFMNSSVWAQCESISAFFVLFSIYELLKGNQTKGVVLYSIGFIFKLQAVFLMPVIILFLLKNWISWRRICEYLAIFISIFVLPLLPAWIIAGRPISDLLLIYARGVGSRGFSNNATSIWTFLPFKLESEYYTQVNLSAISMAVILVIAVFVTFFINQNKINSIDWLKLSVLIAIMVPLFLPKMHDRYFYIAEIMAYIYAFVSPGRWLVPILLTLASTGVYIGFLFGGTYVGIPSYLLTMLNCIALAIVVKDFIASIRLPRSFDEIKDAE